MKKYIYILVLLYQIVAAQNEGNIWYFGYGAGLDFNSGAAVPISGGQLNTYEGCASISDANGDVLFYTDGITIYDKSHGIMSNGTGLFGHPSSTQSAIIVKKPQSATIYYVFTIDGITGDDGGLFYSEIDISLNGGLGAVTNMKNIELFTDAAEKVTAIKHANGSDFWIVAPQHTSNTYYSYLLTSTGISLSPVQSYTSVVHNDYGYLSASSDGSKICAAFIKNHSFDLFDFDNSTGVLTFQLTSQYIFRPYGVAFSPNNSVLYISAYYGIHQYDLTAGSDTAILNLKHTVSGTYFDTALQLALDHKIYHVAYNSPIISRINAPNLLGALCDYESNAVQLIDGARSGYGLPSFFSSIFNYSFSIFSSNLCFGDSSLFSVNTSPDSVLWNFGDPESGLANTSDLVSPTHQFSAPGVYSVVATVFLLDSVLVKEAVVTISRPVVNLGNDTTLCTGAELTLEASNSNATYVWQDGSTDSTFLVSNSGMYWLEVTQNICSVADSINIDVINLEIDLGSDTTLCNDATILLDPEIDSVTYVWQDASTASTFLVSNAGLYWLEVSQNICSVADSIRIDVINLEIDLGSDTTLCYGENRLLNPTLNSDTYVWQDGSTDSTFLVSNTGLYWLEVSQNICSVADSISIAINPLVTAILSGEDSTCRGVPFTVDAMISATGKGPFSIELSNGDSKFYHYAAENEFEIPITEEGVYTISTIYGSNLCVGKVTGEAVYFTLPTPNAKFSVKAKDVFSDLGSVIFKNNSMGQTSSNWSFGDDFYLEDNSSMIYHSYGDLDTYTIQLFVENDIGCRDSTVQDFVVQSNNYFLPNAFTPFDRNNINDYFGLYNTRVQGFEMKIFDKWGKAIYVTDDIERPWDGTHKGVNVLSGVYAYTINLIDPTGALRKLKGNVVIIE